jgi:hypothetical protein
MPDCESCDLYLARGKVKRFPCLKRLSPVLAETYSFSVHHHHVLAGRKWKKGHAVRNRAETLVGGELRATT